MRRFVVVDGTRHYYHSSIYGGIPTAWFMIDSTELPVVGRIVEAVKSRCERVCGKCSVGNVKIGLNPIRDTFTVDVTFWEEFPERVKDAVMRIREANEWRRRK